MSNTPPVPTGDLTTDLAKGIAYAPRFIAQWVLGLILACISDYTIFGFVVLGVVAGFAAGSYLIGLLTFFGVYALLRITVDLGRFLAAAAAANRPPS